MASTTPATSLSSESPPGYTDAVVGHGSGPRARLPAGKERRVFPLDIPILHQLKGKRIILASASPRRKQLLAQIGFDNFEITPSTKPENLDKSVLSPLEYVSQTSSIKCLSVYEQALENSIKAIPDPALVIAADTIIVTIDGRILEKPRSEVAHIAMLKLLRDQKVHKVYTAVTVLAPREDSRHPGYNAETMVEETKVVFDTELSDDMILAYVRTREGADKAGGYGIQGIGALLIESIEGSYDNVVGLPVRATLRSIERVVFDQEDEGNESDDDDDDAPSGGWIGQYLLGGK